MGWMHDTLNFFTKEPVHRKHHVDTLTFSMLYEYTERFINSISHDEVVHGKGAVIEKMPGDFWQKLANLRLLFAYQYTRPGKQLVFMGTEFAQHNEWNHDASIDWHIADHPQREALQQYLAELARYYQQTPALWRSDADPHGFEWIDCSDKDNTVLSYLRKDGDKFVIVVLNFTPVPRSGYRIGVPKSGRYVERLSSDDQRFGGSRGAQVAGEAEDRIAGRGLNAGDRGIDRRLGPAVDDDAGAFGGERRRDRVANAGGAAGDECQSAGEIEVHVRCSAKKKRAGALFMSSLDSADSAPTAQRDQPIASSRYLRNSSCGMPACEKT